MSDPNNNIVREVARKSVFPDIQDLLDNTISFNQGDLLCLKANKVQKPTADADTVNALGVAVCTVVNGKLKSPYQGVATDAAEAAGPLPGPAYGVIAEFELTDGEAYVPGDPIYADVAVEQKVTKTQPAGSEAIGIYAGRAFTASTGDKGEVHVGSQVPGGVLAL